MSDSLALDTQSRREVGIMRHERIDQAIEKYGKGLLTLPEFVEEVTLAFAVFDCDCLGCSV